MTPYNSSLYFNSTDEKPSGNLNPNAEVFKMKHNFNYNMAPVLVKNIKGSRYFWSLKDKYTVDSIIEEILEHVNHLYAFVSDSGSASSTPSSAFCILFKLISMKLTKDDVYRLTSQESSAYVRCVGFLLVRFVCEPEEIWSFVGTFLKDSMPVTPFLRKSSITVGKFLQNIFQNEKYCGTLFPRIPRKYEIKLKMSILKDTSSRIGNEEKAPSTVNRERSTRENTTFAVGDIVLARYSGDGKWYKAVAKSHSFKGWKVTYIDYGNSEIVKEKFLKLVRTHAEEQARKEREENALKEEVLHLERQKATTSRKHEYARRLGSLQADLSIQANSDILEAELSVKPKYEKRHVSGHQILQQRRIDVEKTKEDLELERKRQEKRKLLERMYGTMPAAPKQRARRY